MYFIFLLTYLFMFTFNTAFTILGYVVIPPMALLHKYTTKTEISIINGREILVWKSPLMFIWGNNEDGLIGASEYKDKPIWFRIIYWTTIRNPANNIRFIPYLSVTPTPSKIKFKVFGKILDFDGNEVALDNEYRILDKDEYRFTTLTWQGIYSNIRIQFKMRGKIWRFWLGFKLNPEDQFGLWELDYRRYGAGFARQFKRIYPRENK